MSKIQNLTKPQSHNFTNQAYAQLNRSVLTIFIALLLITSIVMSILVYSISKSADRESRSRDENSFDNAVASIDSDIAVMDYYSKSLLQNSSLLKVAAMDDQDEGFLLQGMYLKKSLTSSLITASDFPVSSYHIFFRNNDYVASINTFIPFDQYFLRYYTAAKDSSYWYEAQFADNGNGKVYPLFDLNLKNDDSYMYLVDLDSLTIKNTPVTVGYLIRNTKFAKLFDNVNLEDGDFIYVTDKENNILFYINSDYKCTPVPEDFDQTIKKTKYTYLVDSSVNDWTYHLVMTNNRAPFIMVFAYLLLAASFLAGLYLVYKLVNPIAELDAELAETAKARDELEDVVRATTPVVNRIYLKQLMKSTFSSEAESRYIRKFLQLDDPDLQFYVLHGVYYHNDSEILSENTTSVPAVYDPDKTLETVSEALSKELCYNEKLYIWPISDKNIAVLIPFKKSISPDDQLLTLQNKVLNIHADLLSNHSIWLLMGIGLVASYDNIWESYQQARDASGYTSKNYIFLPYSLMKKNSAEYYFPIELSNRMIQFITSGNSSSVNELFQLVYKENIEDRALSYTLLTYLLSDIRNTILKARFKIETSRNVSPNIIAEIDKLFSEEPTFNNCKEAALKLCGITELKRDDDNPITQIVDYINANYRDPSMSLSKISEEFGISESYFSHMFKDSMNINFSTYLEDLRLNEAAQMIKERGKDGKSLTEIAESVGYNSIVSFRRAFKKKFNVTPTALEEEN